MQEKIKVEIEAESGEISFKKRSKIYQAKVKGFFRKSKSIISYILLFIFFSFPFITYNRGENVPDQAVLIDLSTRKFYFFSIEVWPQEAYYFIGLLVFSALLLFFVTSLLGRVWCGYACPQTVFSDIFYRIEEFIEGSYQKRQRQDKNIWSLSVLPKKIIKHSLWLILSLMTGITVTLYFTDSYAEIVDIFTLKASYATYFWSLFLTFTTYCFAGFAREYICIYACPYARFQGAMMDEDSLVVAYDDFRGEPRGKNKDSEQQGDCIACDRCVAVCPVGIDIRDGQQYECINCGLCIDACNDIMQKVNKPLNLIKYNTLRNLSLEKAGKKEKLRILRPRTIIYGVIVLLLGSLLLFGLMFKKQIFEINIQPNRSPMFVQLSNGDIRNIYTLKIVNKSHEIKDVNLNIKGLEHFKLDIQPKYNILEQTDSIVKLKLKTNKVNKFKIFLDSDSYNKKDSYQKIKFILQNNDIIENYETKFTYK